MENLNPPSSTLDASTSFHIPILETIKSAQLQNGLRHRDYQRYRRYCARRLRRIRKSTKLTHGKGKAFIQREIDAETGTDARILYLPLYNAERAWSYAMELKEDDTLEKSKYGEEANSRIKFHLTGRLRKASEWSQRLAALCNTKADARTSLEAEAYAANMTGIFLFHKELHEMALRQLKIARQIYSDLEKIGTISQKELFQGCVDELEPFIRFCNHRLSLHDQTMDDLEEEESSNALLQSKIATVLLEARKQRAESLETIAWKEQNVPILSRPIAMAFLRFQEIRDRLNGFKIKESVYLKFLSAFDDLMRFLKAEQHNGSTISDQSAVRLLIEYAQFCKWTKQIDRSIDMLLKQENDCEPTNTIHILQMVIQNVHDILKIPELEAKANSIYTLYQKYEMVFQCFRTAQIAELYANCQQFPEALKLYQHAITLLPKDRMGVEVLETFTLKMKGKLLGAPSRIIAEQYLKSPEFMETKLKKLNIHSQVDRSSLLARKDAFLSGKKSKHFEIVSLPCPLELMQSKPLLFDIAYNELKFPDISERMKTLEERDREEQAKNSGFFHWFR